MTSPLVEEVDLRPEQRRALERLLGRLVVEPRVIWVPLGDHPVTTSRARGGNGPSGFELESWMRRKPTTIGAFGPAWERLEAQVSLCLASGSLSEAAGYAASMLGWAAKRSAIVWEGPRGASRAWVRNKAGVVLPLPLGGAVERALTGWWGLSGGFYNQSNRLLALPKPLKTAFPHWRAEDEDALKAHPSSVPYEQGQWLSLLEGAEIRLGVQHLNGIPVRATPEGPSHIDWCQNPEIAWGLEWLRAQKGTLEPSVYKAATKVRTSSGA